MIKKNVNETQEPHPKNLLVGNQEFFNLMFELLSHDEDYDVDNIWKLLMKLPQDEVPTAIKLNKLEINSEEEWNELIDGHSLHKMLYSLQIISNKSQDSDTEWLNKFLMAGGYQHLFSTLLKIDPSKIISNLAFRSVDILCRLILGSMEKQPLNADIEGAPDLVSTYREHSIVAIDKILRIISQITMISITEYKKRGNSYDDLFYKNKKLEQQSMRLLSYYEKSKSDGEQEEQNTFTRQIAQLNKKFEEGGKFISLAFKLFYYLDCFNNETCIQQFIEFPELSELLRNILFASDNFYMRNNFGDSLMEICSNVQNELPMFLDFKKTILLKLIYEMDEVSIKNDTRAYKAIEVITNILTTTRNYQLVRMNIDFEEILKKNVKIIFEKETTEKSSADFDHILYGALSHTKIIIQQFPTFKDKYGKILLRYLLNQCLFEVPKSAGSMTKVRPPKCKYPNTRVITFSLINALCRDNIENIEIVMSFLYFLQDKSGWRSKHYGDWTISPHTDEKSQTGYVGVKNLGCICYMISMLQQLYMIPSFRESILGVDDPKKEEVPKEDNLLYQLQCIFAFLNQSEQQYFNPQGFTNAFKDWDGNPTNVLIQMDVDEFFNMFMDKLECAIKGSKQEKMIQDHFGGQYANELICKGCPHYSESKEPYLAVNLQVKNKKSIKDSLKALIEGEMLDGDNAYYCEKCDKKVSTLKRTCIKRLPKHLIMVLKRFEFDYNYMQKLKVNDYCEFPDSINMEPYTQEGLKRREEQAKRDEKKEEDEEPPIEPKYPLGLYDYRLSGVLVHSGYAEGGHYYSFIKDRELTDEERWYEFNDELVKDFDKEDLESECFGGEEKWGDSNFGHFLSLKNTEKNRNAYVLFYERVSEHDIPYEDEEEDEEQSAQPADNKEESDIVMDSEHNEEVPELQMVRKNTIKVPDDIGDMVEEDNRKYWQSRFMFSSQYSDFILELCSLWNTKNITLFHYDARNRDYKQKGIDEDAYKEEIKKVSEIMKANMSENYTANKNIKVFSEKILLPSESIDMFQKYGGEKIDQTEFEIFKQVTTFYLTVKQRAVPKELIPEILDLIKSYLNKSLKASKWLISQFSNREVLLENLVTCPIGDMRRLTGGIVYCAMVHLYEEEKEHLSEYWEFKEGKRESYFNSHLLNFINLLLCNMEDTRKHTENNSQYFNLIAKFAGLGPEARIYLLKAKILARISNFYLQDSSIDADKFVDDKSLIYEENQTPEIGLPTSDENAYVSIWEEMIMKKREAAIADGMQDYTHIWEILSLCFRSCQIGESSDLDTFVDHVRFKELDESDLRFCTLEEADYLALIKTCTNKLSIKFIGDFLIHAMLSVPNLEDKIRKLMIQEINDKQLDEIESYFPIFKRYLLIQDDNTESRLAEGIKSYLQIIENNVKFPTFMARFTAFLVKLCNKSRAVAEYLAATPEDWEWIIEWMRKNPNTSKNGHQLKTYTRESANSQYKIKRLDDIKKGEIVTYEDEYDSDDDMYHEKSYNGKKLDVQFLGQTWVTAEVIISLDEMVNLSYSFNNIQKSPWVSIEACEYAPHMAMQNRHDVVMIEEFKKIIREQYRSSIQQHEETGNQIGMSDSHGYSYEEPNNDSVSDD